MLNSDLGKLSRDWNELAGLDALWAIESRPDKKFAKWTIEEFLQSGIVEVERIMSDSRRLGRPLAHGTALDFGCGVGRLSRPLASKFDHVEAVDISERMVATGREIHRGVRNLNFRVNPHADLRDVATNTFDLVCSIIVLQHLPNRAAIEAYLAEFVRVLRPGGLLAFQLPTALPLVRHLLARRTPYITLRRVGFSPRFLYFRLGLHPMHMIAIPSQRVITCLNQAGARVLEVVPLAHNNSLYYATR